MKEKITITVDNLVYEEISKLIQYKLTLIEKKGTKYIIDDIVGDYNVQQYIKCIYYNYNIYYEDNYIKIFILKEDAPILTFLENKNDLSVLIFTLKNSNLGNIMSIIDNNYEDILIFQSNNEVYIDLNYTYENYSNLSHKIINELFKNFILILNKDKDILKGDIKMENKDNNEIICEYKNDDLNPKYSLTKDRLNNQLLMVQQGGECTAINITKLANNIPDAINNYIKIMQDKINTKSEKEINDLIRSFLKTNLDTKSLESIYKDYLYINTFLLTRDQINIINCHMQCVCYLAFNK